MARFRLSRLAREDIARILAPSGERWGTEGKRRYAAMIAMAMRQMASDPDGVATRNRGEILRGVRSFHIRHARADDREPKVKRPVHVLYYRTIRPGLIEIVRVLHERMEPSRHISDTSDN
jgi:toxin ParE1/3/4